MSDSRRQGMTKLRLPAVRAIFFDAVGTLLHPEPKAAEAYRSIGQRYGSRLSLEETAARFQRAMGRQQHIDETLSYRTSEDREWRRWRAIVAEVLDDVADPDACFNALYDHFGRAEAWRYESSLPELTQALAKRNFHLGIASNFDRRLRGVLRQFPELNGLSTIAISSEVGWRKPAREFFEAIRRLCELPAEQILIVGDDFENDWRGAEALGMRAVLFDPKRHHVGRACLRIESLDSLLGLLD